MNESKATRYQRLRRRARGVGVACMGGALAVIALTPLSQWLASLATDVAPAWLRPAASIVSLIIFVVPVVLVAELAAFPAVLYQALSLDGPYGRASETVEDVLSAQIQATLVTLPSAILAGAVVLFSVAVAGVWWWGLAGMLLALALAGALRGAPVLLGRLAALRPIDRPELAVRLAQLADRTGVEIAGINEWVIAPSAPTTALVTGVGRAKRVLLSSELVRTWADHEVAVVVAHELAHLTHRDLWRTLALDALLLSGALLVAHVVVEAAAPALGLTWPPGDLAALPALALVGGIMWMVATPLRHAQSRRQERRADMFALSLTGQVDAFGAAIRRLSARSLAEERPSTWTRWFYHRHPSVAERLALAEEYRKTSGNRVHRNRGS